MTNSTQTDDTPTFVTKEGLKQLQQELEYLKNVRRREVAKRLEEAISYGDLSENSEYEEAKNEQAFVEGRILELEEKIKHAQIIATGKHGKVVELGSVAVIKQVKPREGELEEYTIVGSTEADPLNQKISNESPIGAALLDHKVGDVVEVKIPAGKVSYKITNLK
ncbi:MAG: transcription elongation factor GreA, transcription elongation factor GreA [Candidatus Peregrinibacteria bacterium GW2011_GWE2_39_6]|nr:MAG: transcription elongation factor GreA, transcription elongation factor GreA [Candidatus Peregrinibacteria bacterium GW2011_GWF2_39_17]KKR24088.1 MAG: transcription elongation factor GreA, transcription elongation factor GreA [Candidatus Peregrinibacteria bacterium GW2011_GWE2_39_6]HCW32253.1 transcription elongation factor GreA [Candidatus Peregrinibacteria bacterium]